VSTGDKERRLKETKDCFTFSCCWWELETSHVLRSWLFLFELKTRTQLMVQLF